MIFFHCVSVGSSVYEGGAVLGARTFVCVRARTCTTSVETDIADDVIEPWPEKQEM